MEYTNSKGLTYYLNAMTTKTGRTLYYFSRDKRESIVPQPKGYTVIENARTGLPMLKKA